MQRSAERCTTARKTDFIIRVLVLMDMFDFRKESIHLH